MSETLILAVPSKGRLQENVQNFFTRAGMPLLQARGAREYRGALGGVTDVEVAYLSASEIAGALAAGAAHVGVTGEDLVRENIPQAESRVTLLQKLGFGHANVVVAVPQAWIDVSNMDDLDDVASHFHGRTGRRIRVATKYVNLTRSFFARHGIVDYRIVESAGATEGTPASGSAELIVDITTTGATLAANALKVVDDGVHPALGSQSGRLPHRALDHGRARGGPGHVRPHGGGTARPHHARGAHPLRAVRRQSRGAGRWPTSVAWRRSAAPPPPAC